MVESKNDWLEGIKALLIAIILAFVIKTFFFTPIIVDGPSMKPTLHDGDQMIVNKFLYQISTPDRFDVIVFHASEQKDFIKRIIGLPGEHVSVRDNTLYVDEKQISQPFLNESDSNLNWQIGKQDFKLEDLPGGYEHIPDKHFLVLGDNRGNSTDSRVFGVINKDQIVGKASLIYWPLTRIRTLGE